MECARGAPRRGRRPERQGWQLYEGPVVGRCGRSLAGGWGGAFNASKSRSEKPGVGDRNQPPRTPASWSHVAALDHIILKVNDLEASVAFYTWILGFAPEGRDGPFTVLRVGPDCQLQLAPWGTGGHEHYAFAVSRLEFERIFDRIKQAGIAHGPTFDSVGVNTGPGNESGARGQAPTLYFNDPNEHLLEIRSYEP